MNAPDLPATAPLSPASPGLPLADTQHFDELHARPALAAAAGAAAPAPGALPLTPAYGYLGHKPEDFPLAGAWQDRILSLPMFPELTDEQIAYVADSVREFYKK